MQPKNCFKMELFMIFPSTCLLHTHIPRVTHMFLWGGHEWKGLEAPLCTEMSTSLQL